MGHQDPLRLFDGEPLTLTPLPVLEVVLENVTVVLGVHLYQQIPNFQQENLKYEPSERTRKKNTNKPP